MLSVHALVIRSLLKMHESAESAPLEASKVCKSLI